MTSRVGKFLKAEDGNAVIDWVVLMTGIVLLAISVVITITSNIDQINEDAPVRVEQMEYFRPA